MLSAAMFSVEIIVSIYILRDLKAGYCVLYYDASDVPTSTGKVEFIWIWSSQDYFVIQCQLSCQHAVRSWADTVLQNNLVTIKFK